MNVAVCFSGQARAVNNLIDRFNTHLLQPYKPDIFAFFWSGYEEILFLDKFRPVSCIVTPQKNLFKDKEWERRGNTPSMTYAIREANKLKKDRESLYKFTYDVVVRVRTDLSIIGTPPLDITAPNKIFVTKDRYCNGSVSDQFAFGDSLSMDKYSLSYDFMLENETNMCGEAVIYSNAVANGLSFELIPNFEHELLVLDKYLRGKKYWWEEI